MPHFERHVFICTNRREPGNPKGCCAEKGSEAIRETFKRELAERGLKGRIRANAAGCLDQCARGPTVVVYPEQTWYTVPTPADAIEIIESHLINGRPVERLLMRSPGEAASAPSLAPQSWPEAAMAQFLYDKAERRDRFGGQLIVELSKDGAQRGSLQAALEKWLPLVLREVAPKPFLDELEPTLREAGLKLPTGL